MASLADAGMVTVGVMAASVADAGMALPANPAGVVTVGVASLADAEMAFPADPAGVDKRMLYKIEGLDGGGGGGPEFGIQ